MGSHKKYRRWAVSVWIWLILGAGGAAVGAGTAYFSAALLADAGRAAVAEQIGARPPVPETGSGTSRPAERVREVGFVERNGRDDASAGTPRAAPWQVSQLFELANHQIAEGRIDGPIGDNALETYRLLVALSSDEPLTTELGTRLSVAVWRLAMTAREGGLWDQSLRYFEDLHMLPPVPSEEISSRPVPASVPAEDSPGSPSPQPAPESGTTPMPQDVAPRLDTFAMARGDQLLAERDIVGARRFYERAAAGGSPIAAMALAKTYDPSFLSANGIRASLGDPAAARRWYEAAMERGDGSAAAALERLRSGRTVGLR